MGLASTGLVLRSVVGSTILRPIQRISIGRPATARSVLIAIIHAVIIHAVVVHPIVQIIAVTLRRILVYLRVLISLNILIRHVWIVGIV